MESLANRYRPQTFEDVCGQQSILKILQRQLETGQIKNAYLFCGPSGTGKTTLSRILANLINKGNGTPIEIDAASNNGVDNIRSIIDQAQTRAIDCKYKVIIIDECHAITSVGWQAFLKTLEEPPTYTVFMLCTTNPEKLPVTILNRVMRFNLSKIPFDLIRNRLNYIAEKEGFKNYKESTDYIAKISHGQMRDAIVSLEKVSDYSNDISIQNTLSVLGSYSYDEFLELTNSIIDINEGNVLTILEKADMSGKDLKGFVDQYLGFVIDLIKYSCFRDMSLTKLPSYLEDKVKYAISFERNHDIFNIITNSLLSLKNNIRYDDNYNLTIKASFIEMMSKIEDVWKIEETKK